MRSLPVKAKNKKVKISDGRGQKRLTPRIYLCKIATLHRNILHLSALRVW